MRILVTGGAGFIGSHVAQAFVDAGHEVFVLDNLSTGRRENVPEQAEFIPIDVTTDEAGFAVASIRPDVINHHAAHADVRQSVLDPLGDARANVLGLLSLLQAAAQARTKKFIFASSGGAIYGEPDTLPCGEGHPLRPISPYGAAKLAAEVYVQTFGRTCDLDYTILRYPNVYGPRQHPFTEEGQVVAIFARQMLAGIEPTIYGDGGQGRDFVYVRDVVEANLLTLERGSGGVFNLGTGQLTTVDELYRRLRSLTAYQGEVQYAPARPGEIYRISLDASLAQDELGWEASTPLDDGLRNTVDWMRGEL